MSLLDTASLVITPNGTKAGTLYSVVPSSGAGDMTVTRATTATRVNSAGLIESVASNVSRLDYSNGTCPSILVEPQRTNLLKWSEDFTNSDWSKTASSISANAITAPTGLTTADKIVESTANSGHYVETVTPTTGGAIYTVSNYFKKAERNFAYLGAYTNESKQVYVNLTTGAVTTTAGTIISYNVDSLTNGWFKVSITFTATTEVYTFFGPSDNGTNFSYTGDGTSGIYAWGAQLEAGSYATSYIPTTSASVTRNADVISKTGISSLIGQTEGTMFLDFYYNGNSKDFIPIELYGSGRLTFYVGANNILYYEVSGTSVAIETLSALTNGRYKIACIYKANDFALYLNGVQQGTFNSGSIPTLNALNISDLSVALGAYKQQIEVNNVALWKTRLTNTQLAQLTTI